MMYKDDNIVGGCSDTLLRMMIEGRGNSCPTCENSGSYEREGCSSSCDDDRTWGLTGHPLASVYAPLQDFEEVYDLETALKQGTAFAKLDLPFTGDRRVSKGGSCRG